MDLNGDGYVDILSGCYSSKKKGMAGYFYVLYGDKGNVFKSPVLLNGTDSKPLEIMVEDEDRNITEKICTRPSAADINGDGKLDLVVGNFQGSLYTFEGKGNGKFAPASVKLKIGEAHKLLGAHSDPFMVDWDSDGDLDILSGSASGGVQLSINSGSAKKPSYKKPIWIVEAPSRKARASSFRYGDSHIVAPQEGTRVWAEDVNGDGKLDMLVGDNTTLRFLPEGVTEEKSKELDAAWQKRLNELFESKQPDAERSKLIQAHFEKRQEHLIEKSTGFVWLYYKK